MAALDRRLPAGIGWRAILGLVALALFARAVPVLRGSGLTGYLGYDDGVYFGAAIAFVHGALPYRDVLFLHPPGIIVLLSPFAAIGTLTGEGTGMALARSVFILLGVVNTVLVALLASKHSRSAGILAGVLYAAWHATAGFERTTLLVPPQMPARCSSMRCRGHASGGWLSWVTPWRPRSCWCRTCLRRGSACSSTHWRATCRTQPASRPMSQSC